MIADTGYDVFKIKVILVGPDINAKGGIAASIALLKRYVEGKNMKVVAISTTEPDSPFYINMLIYLRSLYDLAKELVFSSPSIVHVHTASRGSFIRKSIICLTCMVFRVPFVLHLHGGGFKDF